MKRKDNPSPAQIAHRHKFVTIGAVESMKGRIQQLLYHDDMIPDGDFKADLEMALKYIEDACIYARELQMKGHKK
jgi:hypothetical protein